MKPDRVADIAAAAAAVAAAATAITVANYALLRRRRRRRRQSRRRRRRIYIPYSRFVFNLDAWPDSVIVQRLQLII